MRRVSMFRCGMAAAAVFSGLLITRPAQAMNGQDMPGDWEGFGQSFIDAHQIEPCWDINPLRGRRLQSTLEIAPCWFPVEFTLSASGHFEASGTDDDGESVQVLGRTRAMADGSVRVVSMLYLITNADGSLGDIGSLALMQMQGGVNWADGSVMPVPDTGGWTGRYASRTCDGSVDLALVQEPSDSGRGFSTEIMGNASMMGVVLSDQPDAIKVDLSLNLHGTGGLAPPSILGGGPTTFAALGWGSVNSADSGVPAGMIALFIGLAQPPNSDHTASIQGNYRLFRNSLDVFLFIWFDSDTSFNQGTFSTQKVRMD